MPLNIHRAVEIWDLGVDTVLSDTGDLLPTLLFMRNQAIHRSQYNRGI